MVETIIVVIPLMLSPGPANLVSFALTARFGFSQILFFLLGISLVYILVAIILGLITNQVTGQFSIIADILKLLGGLFIVYLGVQLLRRKSHNISTKAPTLSNGVLLQILNPKYPPVVLSVFAHSQNQHTLLTAGIISIVGAMGLLLYAAAGALIHHRASPDKWLRRLDMLFGTMLCLVGLFLLVDGLSSQVLNNATQQMLQR